MEVGHGNENPPLSLVRFASVHGQEVVEQQHVPAPPRKGDGTLAIKRTDFVENGCFDRAAVAEISVARKSLTAEGRQQHLSDLGFEIGLVKQVRVIEPPRLASLQMRRDRLADL